MAFSEQTKDGVVFLKSGMPGFSGGVALGFSTRLGGVSAGVYSSLNLGYRRGDDPVRVTENFRRFCAAVGARADHLVCSSQVHGSTVRVVTARDPISPCEAPAPIAADAMISNETGVTLAVFTADCIPILLFDPKRKAIGAVHAGWRGTALGIAQETVRAMQAEFGCAPADLFAAIGPGISACCFETEEDVPAALHAALGDDATPYLFPDGRKWRVDLKGLNAFFLQRAGLPVHQIDCATLCTACRPDLFWSHRRLGDRRGSQAAVIALTAGD